jgi:CRISPR system Cascade subunit CasD
MMSFGGQMVDNNGVIREFPAVSMITGLLGNALGYGHNDNDKLQSLQNKLHFAIRCDSPGKKIVDYQTVDFAKPFMEDTGWTTFNKPESRRGGSASKGIHQRYRDYLTDAVYTIALTLKSPTEEVSLVALEQALQTPARPLFIGRKCCLPSEPILVCQIQTRTLIDALQKIPLAKQAVYLKASHKLRIWCSSEELLNGEKRLFPITDERDWANQIHCGRRMMQEGIIELQGCRYE